MTGIAIRRATAWIAGTALWAAGAGGSAPAQTPAAVRTVPVAEAFDLGGIETRSAALMLSAQEAGDLEVSVAAIALPGDAAAASGPSRVVLVVDIAGGSLLAAAPAAATEVGADPGGGLLTEVYAYALDAEGGLADTLTRAFRLDLRAHRQALAAGGVKFFGHLDLLPGEYSLRVLTLQRRSGRLALTVVPLTVPAWSGAPALHPPVARDTSGGWLLVFEEGEPPPPFPVTIDGEPILPATRWRVDAGATSGYLVLGRALGPEFRAHLLGGPGEAPRELPTGETRAVAGGVGGLEAVAAALDARDLESGEYRLRITLPSGIATAAPLTIRPAEDPGLWAIRGGPARGHLPSLGRQAQTERVARARQAYRAALGALARRDHDAMLRPLVELERAEIGGGERLEQKRLGEAELSAAWEIAGGDAEGLLPLLWIHGELYRQYHSRELYQLATHSRRLISHLVEIYVERATAPAARHLAACALADVAGYLHGIGALPAAKEAYEGVLEVAADETAALIGLATIAESYGDYETAADLLGRLRRGPSPEPQVSLRLGINLRRLGKDRRAAKLLRESLAASAPDWVAAVAAQELASLLGGQGNENEAIAVLEAAIERHPDLQRPRIQLAALLDLTGRSGAARTVLDRLDPAAGRDASSPRLRYSRMPTRALAEARRTLAEEARQRLPRLIAAGVAPAEAARPKIPAGGPGGGA